MRDATLVILNSLRIKCHIRRPLKVFSTFTVSICEIRMYQLKEEML